MGEYFSKIIDFLAQNDFPSIMERFRTADLHALLSNPVFWIIVVPIVLVLILQHKARYLILGASIILFGVLVQQTLAPPGEVMPLYNLLKFIGGTVGLMVVNVYYLWIKAR